MGSEYLRMEKFQKVSVTSYFLWFSANVSGDALSYFKLGTMALCCLSSPMAILTKGCGRKPKIREAVRMEIFITCHGI